MANIAIQKNGGSAQVVPSPAAREWDPFRMIRDMVRWDPFQEMAPYGPTERAGFLPAFEVKETKDEYLFKADLPGVKDKDVDVTLTGNRLSITGKRDTEHQEKTDTYYVYERSYGTFSRAFTLPEGVDGGRIRAELKDGVLSVALPKRPELQAKKIPIGTGAADPAKPKS